MRRGAIVLLAATGCGRVAFDPTLATDATIGNTDTPVDGDSLTIPTGAQIWLRMDTDPTDGVIDSAGGHNAQCVGTCPTPVAGRHGGGFRFNGEEVVVDNRADLDSSAGFTGAIWINLTTVPGPNVEAAWVKTFNSASGFDTFALTFQDMGVSRFDGESPAGTALTQLGPIIPTGEWHHYAIAWDGTVRRDYLDGTQVAMSTVQIGSGTEPMELGFARGAYYIDAVLDDAVYYTRALTPGEITQLATP